MTMTAHGLAKLAEECGELSAVIGKRLAYFTTDEHPDGGPPLTVRLEDEIADVMAACEFVLGTHGLDRMRVFDRVRAKVARFERWHRDANNNEHGVDAHAGQGSE